MDRRNLRASRKRHHQRKPKGPPREYGVAIRERDGFFHIVGTLRVKGRKLRLRESTGLRAIDALREAADAQLLARVGEIQGEVIHGVKPTVALAVAAHHYLKRPRARGRAMAKQDVGRIQALTKRYGLRLLAEISDAEWTLYVDQATLSVGAATRERFLNLLCAFLNWCRARPRQWIAELPAFERDNDARNPNRRKRRRVGDLRPELIGFMIEHASPHLKGQLVAEWSTGARVGSVLHGVRVCDLQLAPGRERLTFNDLKNGTTVDASLHPWAADRLREFVEWRGRMHDREAPLFVRHDRRPYEPGDGAQNKTAFNAMKRRAAFALLREAAKSSTPAERRQALKADAKLIWKVTQHWFRHLMATRLIATTQGNLKTVMEQVGWLDPRSAMGYMHDVPELRRAAVASLEAPTIKKENAS